MAEIVDTYHYCDADDNYKKELYNRKLTLKEKRKTKKIGNRISDYIKEIESKEKIVGKTVHPENSIKYYQEIGYISLVNTDRDKVDIYYYGKAENEAFYNAIIDYEMDVNRRIELEFRDGLNDDYSYRFTDGKREKDDYHGPFFWAELSLQDFKWYFKDNIPQELLDYFENYINEFVGTEFKYDPEKNRIVKKQKQKLKERKN